MTLKSYWPVCTLKRCHDIFHTPSYFVFFVLCGTSLAACFHICDTSLPLHTAILISLIYPRMFESPFLFQDPRSSIESHQVQPPCDIYLARMRAPALLVFCAEIHGRFLGSHFHGSSRSTKAFTEASMKATATGASTEASMEVKSKLSLKYLPQNFHGSFRDSSFHGSCHESFHGSYFHQRFDGSLHESFYRRYIQGSLDGSSWELLFTEATSMEAMFG